MLVCTAYINRSHTIHCNSLLSILHPHLEKKVYYCWNTFVKWVVLCVCVCGLMFIFVMADQQLTDAQAKENVYHLQHLSSNMLSNILTFSILCAERKHYFYFTSTKVKYLNWSKEHEHLKVQWLIWQFSHYFVLLWRVNDLDVHEMKNVLIIVLYKKCFNYVLCILCILVNVGENVRAHWLQKKKKRAKIRQWNSYHA